MAESSGRRVLFRCDAGPFSEIGTGHLARCLLVADVLQGKGVSCAFCGRYDAVASARLEAAGYAVIEMTGDTSESALLLQAVEAHRPQVLVLDRLDTRSEDIASVRDLVKVIITVDDRGDGARLADIVANVVVGGGDAPYESYEYLMIAPPRGGAAISNGRPRVVLSFGGYDYHRYGEQVVQALDDTLDAEFLWLVRSGDTSAVTSPRVTRLEDPPEFGALLASADLAVVNGGLTLFEALANGVPTIALPQYEHQAATIERLAARGAVEPGPREEDGRPIGPAVVGQLSDLLADDKRRERLRYAALDAIDGQGLLRFGELVTVVSRLEWDSQFFGVEIARIHPLRLTPAIVDLALQECEQAGIECIYYLCDCHHAESVELAERAGFHFVDMRLTYERSLDNGSGTLDGDVRDATVDDLPALHPIARTAYRHSRYYFDRRFTREQCQRFYADWLTKCVVGELAARVFVLDDEDGPAAYVGVAHDARATASIVLAGVAERARGRGLAARLIEHAVAWASAERYRRIEVVTQGRNYEAQRLYQRSGFLTRKTELWYHRWAE